jgi:hypothetical protein
LATLLLAQAERLEGNLAAAQSRTQQALRLAMVHGNYESAIADLLLHRGVDALLNNQVSLAVRLFRAALAAETAFADAGGQADAWEFLGLATALGGSLKRADRCLRRAARLRRRAGDLAGAARTLLAQARLALRRHCRFTALLLITRARRLAMRARRPTLIREADGLL